MGIGGISLLDDMMGMKVLKLPAEGSFLRDKGGIMHKLSNFVT